ncbi:MAG: DNA mismatch repair endonuclease MutL [Ruminococcaceae bacterium]|nr:DNA mismatch repair endonuclease MutL [Oscillospiraceae bacterium]
MGKINVLSFAVANLIAAGEVVDRPASVIKELLENAIDAGATRVTVEIRHGGVTFMRVADNGCGMSPEDLPVAIRRHATSKIREAGDLDGIMTLGFRGEALAAIASVSDLRIITRTADAPFGARLEAKAGEVVSVSEQGCPVGTTVIVENLFANVPARRKFLKKDVSEAIAVTTYVEKIALSRPDIAIRLIIDGNMKLDTAGDGELRSAMYAVFGREFTGRMLEVKGTGEGVAVSGYIGRSDNVRPKRNYENFFINGRYVNCRTASAALEQAYTSYIPPEKFPCCVLRIDINPAAVDVNVHPAKLEVKFSNERPVFEAVYSAVRTALEENQGRPDIRLKQSEDPTRAFVPIEEGKSTATQITIDHIKRETPAAFSRMSAADYANRYAGGTLRAPSVYQPKHGNAGDRPLADKIAPAADASCLMSKPSVLPTAGNEERLDLRRKETAREHAIPVPSAILPATATDVPSSPSVPTVSETPAPVWRIVGEAFHTYVIVECDDRLLLIDQHAAHERVLFEELRARMKKGVESSQILLLPLRVEATREEVALYENYRAEIEALGFAFTAREFAIEVSEIPDGLTHAAAADLLMALPATLAEGTGDARTARDIMFEKALYQGACKAAIKGGRNYPPAQIEWLCKKLMELPDITVCPHGRPVAMVLTRAELDRQFNRT